MILLNFFTDIKTISENIFIDDSIIQIFIVITCIKFYDVLMKRKIEKYFTFYLVNKKDSNKFITMIRYLVYVKKCVTKNSMVYFKSLGYIKIILQ